MPWSFVKVDWKSQLFFLAEEMSHLGSIMNINEGFLNKRW